MKIPIVLNTHTLDIMLDRIRIGSQLLNRNMKTSIIKPLKYFTKVNLTKYFFFKWEKFHFFHSALPWRTVSNFEIMYIHIFHTFLINISWKQHFNLRSDQLKYFVKSIKSLVFSNFCSTVWKSTIKSDHA